MLGCAAHLRSTQNRAYVVEQFNTNGNKSPFYLTSLSLLLRSWSTEPFVVDKKTIYFFNGNTKFDDGLLQAYKPLLQMEFCQFKNPLHSMHTCKIVLFQELSSVSDCEVRRTIYQYMLQIFHLPEDVVTFSDEAYVHLSVPVNKQICRYWSVNNPPRNSNNNHSATLK